MPLRIWLPLNGNYKNQGANGSTASSAGGSFVTSGKVTAQCWNSSAKAITIQYPYTSTNAITIATWVKPNSASQWSDVFGFGSTSTLNRLEQSVAAGGSTYTFYANSNAIGANGVQITSALTNATWHHIAMTADGSKLRFYLDGAKVYEGTQANTVSTAFGGATNIWVSGCGARAAYNGYFNDFRVYDHALSQKEVAELAKGLMIHYTLDNPYTTGIYNFYSGASARGDSSGSSYTKTKLADEDGYNFKLTRTGNGGNYWPNIAFPSISRTNFTAGKKYTWSAKVRCHKWTSGSLGLRSAIADNDYTNGAVNVCTPSLADGQWHQYSRAITLNEGMKIGSTFYYLTEAAYNASTETTKAYMSPKVEFYSSNQNVDGTLYDTDFDIKEVQLIESDSFPGWVDNTMASNTVRDNTGRGNDATCSGSVTTEGGSPRNTRALKLLDTSYVQYPVPAGISQCTIAFWVKQASGGGYSTVDCLKNNPGGSMWLAVNTESSKLWAYWGGTYNRVSGSLTANTWYHVAMTFNAGVTQWYLDGVAVGSAVDFSARGTTWPSGTRTIGNSYTGSTWNTKFNGALSDWRFYTTVLTAAQIKELYNAPISVANTGACLSEQFTEGASGISFAKTGVVSCNGISSLPGKYDPEVLIESDGSCWAHIGHHADPTTYKFASSDPFATGVWKDDRRFLDPSFCDNVDKWEFMVMQKADSSAAVKKYRWVQPVNPNTAVYEDVPSSAVTKNTGTGYTTFSTGGIYKFNSSAYYVTNNGSKGNWWGAIGAWDAHQGGIPGWAGTVVKDGGFLDLYIRIDNVTFTSGRSTCSLDKGGNGVLSPEFVEQ